MAKYICTDEYDGFYSTSDDLAMDHVRDNPGHEVVMVEHDPVTGDLRTEIIVAKEEHSI